MEKKQVKRKVRGGIVGIIGYILSPLSFWNDLFVNIPIAYVFAIPFGFISRNLFLPSMIFWYWVTNVVGFMMMHHGAKDLVSKKAGKYTKKELLWDIVISILYTMVVIVIVKLGWLKFPTEYFQ